MLLASQRWRALHLLNDQLDTVPRIVTFYPVQYVRRGGSAVTAAQES